MSFTRRFPATVSPSDRTTWAAPGGGVGVGEGVGVGRLGVKTGIGVCRGVAVGVGPRGPPPPPPQPAARTRTAGTRTRASAKVAPLVAFEAFPPGEAPGWRLQSLCMGELAAFRQGGRLPAGSREHTLRSRGAPREIWGRSGRR